MAKIKTADTRKPPAAFRRIRLALAREPAHPEGDPTHRYLLFVPLDETGRIDVDGWRANRALCRVTRFRPNNEEVIGHIIHGPGGSWQFHYDIEGGDKDESGFRLGEEKFVPGEYVSIKSEDGMHTYQVVSVERA